MSPVGAIFVPFSLKTGTNLLHPLPLSIVERVVRLDSQEPLQFRHFFFSGKKTEVGKIEGEREVQQACCCCVREKICTTVAAAAQFGV